MHLIEDLHYEIKSWSCQEEGASPFHLNMGTRLRIGWIHKGLVGFLRMDRFRVDRMPVWRLVLNWNGCLVWAGPETKQARKKATPSTYWSYSISHDARWGEAREWQLEVIARYGPHVGIAPPAGLDVCDPIFHLVCASTAHLNVGFTQEHAFPQLPPRLACSAPHRRSRT
jgi:hypothetical protein